MVEIDLTKDYYAILGVPEDASQDEIRDAYRSLVKRYHPDTGHGDTDQFHLIQEANEVLSDSIYQRIYDRQRAGQGGTAPVVISTLQSRHEMLPMEGEQVLYLIVDIRPQEGLRGSRRNLNLALVIDRSTSMLGARIQNVKLAAVDLIDSLGPDDRLAVVAFSDRAEVIAPTSSALERVHLRSAVTSISPGGGTEIYQGLAAGISQVERNAAPETISHVLLLTDGRTYGDEELALAAAKRAEANGIGISAFGIGEDWHDMFLDSLAREGGGTSHYIDAPGKIQATLRSQIRGLGSVALKRARIRVTLAPEAHLRAVYRVAPHMEILPMNAENVFQVGNLMAGTSAVLAMELVLSQNQTGARRLARLVVEGEEIATSLPVALWHDVRAVFTHDAVEPVVPPRLLNVLARLSVFRLQESAWRALELGNSQQATHYLESAATHLCDLGYPDLGQAAMVEVNRISQGNRPTGDGRKKLRYGTRALSMPSS